MMFLLVFLFGVANLVSVVNNITFRSEETPEASARTSRKPAIKSRARLHTDRSDRAVVDMVVLAGRDLSAVLRAFGWQPKGEHRKLLRAALCGGLDRMRDLLG